MWGSLLEENPGWSLSISKGLVYSSFSRLCRGPTTGEGALLPWILVDSPTTGEGTPLISPALLKGAHPAVQWIPVGSFEASPLYRSVGYPVASPCFPLCRLRQQTGFVCGVGVLSASTCVLEFLGMLCHLMLPHMLSMDWILGMFV